MAKLRVQFLTSIAGLRDPETAKCDAKYAKIVETLKARERPPADKLIEAHIDTLKVGDRYNEKAIGFPNDFSFKAGDEAMIEEALAKQWIASEICALVEKRAA